jgi:hypothetical protein
MRITENIFGYNYLHRKEFITFLGYDFITFIEVFANVFPVEGGRNRLFSSIFFPIKEITSNFSVFLYFYRHPIIKYYTYQPNLKTEALFILTPVL